jgi:hypothetical protein
MLFGVFGHERKCSRKQKSPSALLAPRGWFLVSFRCRYASPIATSMSTWDPSHLGPSCIRDAVNYRPWLE